MFHLADSDESKRDESGSLESKVRPRQTRPFGEQINNEAFNSDEKLGRKNSRQEGLPFCKDLKWPFATAVKGTNCIPEEARRQRQLISPSPQILPKPISPAVGIEPPRPKALPRPPTFEASFIQPPPSNQQQFTAFQPRPNVQFTPFQAPTTTPLVNQPYRVLYAKPTYGGYNSGYSKPSETDSSSGYGSPTTTPASSSYGQHPQYRYSQNDAMSFRQNTRTYQQLFRHRAASQGYRSQSSAYGQPPQPTEAPASSSYGQPQTTEAPSSSYGQQQTESPSNSYGQPTQQPQPTQPPSNSYSQSKPFQFTSRTNVQPFQFQRNSYSQSQPTQQPPSNSYRQPQTTQSPIIYRQPQPTQPPSRTFGQPPQFPRNSYAQQNRPPPPSNSFRQPIQPSLKQPQPQRPNNIFIQPTPPQVSSPQRRPSTPTGTLQNNELEMYKRLVAVLLKRLGGGGNTLQSPALPSPPMSQPEPSRMPKLLPRPISPVALQRPAGNVH